MPEKEGENIVSEQQKKAQQEPDLNQLRKVRREKLADFQANGKELSRSETAGHGRYASPDRYLRKEVRCFLVYAGGR